MFLVVIDNFIYLSAPYLGIIGNQLEYTKTGASKYLEYTKSRTKMKTAI